MAAAGIADRDVGSPLAPLFGGPASTAHSAQTAPAWPGPHGQHVRRHERERPREFVHVPTISPAGAVMHPQRFDG
jgi:hypothetical protein